MRLATRQVVPRVQVPLKRLPARGLLL